MQKETLGAGTVLDYIHAENERTKQTEEYVEPILLPNGSEAGGCWKNMPYKVRAAIGAILMPEAQQYGGSFGAAAAAAQDLHRQHAHARWTPPSRQAISGEVGRWGRRAFASCLLLGIGQDQIRAAHEYTLFFLKRYKEQSAEKKRSRKKTPGTRESLPAEQDPNILRMYQDNMQLIAEHIGKGSDQDAVYTTPLMSAQFNATINDAPVALFRINAKNAADTFTEHVILCMQKDAENAEGTMSRILKTVNTVRAEKNLPPIGKILAQVIVDGAPVGITKIVPTPIQQA